MKAGNGIIASEKEKRGETDMKHMIIAIGAAAFCVAGAMAGVDHFV